MEPALVLALTVASTLGAFVAADALASLLRWAVTASVVPRQLRFAMATIVVCTASIGAARVPVLAVTPPPAVRITDQPPSAISEPPPSIDRTLHADPVPMHDRYIVQRGDSLWRIARSVLTTGGHTATAAEIGGYWRAIYRSNRGVIGDDPDLIHPGQILELPRR